MIFLDRHLYHKYKSGGHSKDVFVAADFTLGEETVEKLSNELQCDKEQVKKVLIDNSSLSFQAAIVP